MTYPADDTLTRETTKLWVTDAELIRRLMLRTHTKQHDAQVTHSQNQVVVLSKEFLKPRS